MRATDSPPVSPPRPAARVVPVDCAHCRAPVPTGMVEPDADRQFCCGGCRVAFAILTEHGVDAYYRQAARRTRPVRRSGQSYDSFDHEAFRALHVSARPDGLARVELYLESVHCASCVWLIERLPLLLPGVARAELQTGRSLAIVDWDDRTVPLARVARMLDTLGYAPHPFRGLKREQVRRAEDRQSLVRIGVSGAIALNVMLASVALYSGWVSGMDTEFERFFRWVSFLVAIPALLGPGRVFFAGALGALRMRALHMDVPIAIGLAAGFARGAVNTITGTGGGPIYFDGLCTLVFVLLVGRFLQQRGQRRAADSAELLSSLTPHTARLVAADGSLQEVPSEGLLPGQMIDVRAGDLLPADGQVVSGESSINSALLTGESHPTRVTTNDQVFAGTLNVTSSLRVQVGSTGEESRVARLLRQVEESVARKSRTVLLADRLAGVFVLVVLTLAVCVYLYWLPRDAARALDHAIALLIVTCPCALAMATPLAVTVAIGRAAQGGILIKGGDALESLSGSGTLILDKTGTVTLGELSLVQWDGADWVKPLVLALEGQSMHPIAMGFQRAWSGAETPSVEESEHVAGGGIRGTVEGRRVSVGSPAFVKPELKRLPPSEEMVLGTPVWVAVDGVLKGRAVFGDPLRAEAARAVAHFHRRGWKVWLLSGDDELVVRDTATRLAVERFFARASPEEKVRVVSQARREGVVVMVGDGVNDAAAMATAHVGIGVHGGAEVCLSTADVYMAVPGLQPLVDLVEGSRRTMRVIQRGIVFSLAYNVLGASLAMLGMITPLVAAIMMPLSSLTVIVASWRSRTFFPPQHEPVVADSHLSRAAEPFVLGAGARL